MKNYIILVLIIFTIISCDNKSTLEDIFIKTENLKYSKLIPESEYLMGAAGKMLIVDTLLITLDYKNDKMFHIFDIKNNQYINNVGIRGQGPNEFLHPYSLVYSSPQEIISYDALSNSLKEININSMINDDVSYKRLIAFDSISNSSIYPTKYNNYVCFGLYRSNMFKLIDINGNESGSFMEYPIEKNKVEQKMDHRNIAMGYQGSLAINPNKDKLVYTALYGTILGIYNISETSINQKFQLIYDYPQFIAQNNGEGFSSPLTKESIVAFRDVYVTDKYIYALYSGQKIFELNQKAFEAQNIYIFDWDGEPVIHYILDVPVNTIAVHPNNRKIYGISYLPEPTIIEYEIYL